MDYKFPLKNWPYIGTLVKKNWEKTFFVLVSEREKDTFEGYDNDLLQHTEINVKMIIQLCNINLFAQSDDIQTKNRTSNFFLINFHKIYCFSFCIEMGIDSQFYLFTYQLIDNEQTDKNM